VQNGESIHCDSHMEPTEENAFDGDLLVSQRNQRQESVLKEPLVMDYTFLWTPSILDMLFFCQNQKKKFPEVYAIGI
jgi:hypothetical protein